MVNNHFHTGHVDFLKTFNLLKLEHDIYHITLDTVNHGYKGTNGISINQ